MKCPKCNEEFENETGMKIHHKKAHGESISGFKKECAWCEEQVTREKDVFDKAFCSDKCRDKWQSKKFKNKSNPNYSNSKTTLTCKYCGEDYQRWQSQKERSNYCSKKCVYEDNQRKTGEDHPKYSKKELECVICGEKYKVAPSREKTSKFCSRKCQGEWVSQNWTGEDHPRWVHGNSDYYGKNWLSKRKERLEKDNYKCQHCGTEEDLHVHHVKPRREYKKVEDANTINNLITLCISCHPRAEAGKIEVTQ